MRIAVVQFAPKIGHVGDNLTRARALCDQLRAGSVDLVCLPEMIFTGYVFPNSDSILPHLEEPQTGPTSQFCSELAARLRCYVACGYPERLAPQEVESGVDCHGQEVTKVGANSVVLYDPHGAFVANYRKTNLYDTDMTWAKAGTGFLTVNLPEPLGVVTIAICMDLNAQPSAQWTLVDGPYELASHCVSQNTRVLILLNSWLDSCVETGEVKDWYTLNYWTSRLRPLWVRPLGKEPIEDHDDPEDGEQDTGHETIVVVCNRCGEENGVRFAGTSAIFSMKRESGRPALLHAMGRREEGIQIWTV